MKKTARSQAAQAGTIAQSPARPKTGGWLRKSLKILGLLLVAGIVWQAVTWPSVSRLATENPSTTAMIEARLAQAASAGQPPRREQTWVPYNRISPNLKRAVLAGEDAKFFGHDGFDREALEKAMQENWAKKQFVRGASTISQQLIKNLYLSESKNPLRKLKEAALTWQMEKALTKERILEIYLNVIEWGDGIYGAEAASQFHLHKSAANLSPDEAAFLAAMIPNPRTVFNPQKNMKRVQRRKRHILRLMTAVRLPR
ncbi:MAG: monofunctional biosynthetic peptidoglycan transglycosylase [Blastocatellia bacterium]|nr:monofunctional biosynthetic peptidoglycan transglycosylase [Blastocatellia bacterium]